MAWSAHFKIEVFQRYGRKFYAINRPIAHAPASSFVLEQEKSLIKEINGKYLSIIFDGTSRLGEVLAIVIRHIHQWKVHQRLVRLAKTMTGEELHIKLLALFQLPMELYLQ